MADAALLKNLKIKTGVVKRLIAEYKSYKKQVVKDEENAAKLKANATNEDEEYAAKKAESIVKETISMVRDAQGRLGKAVTELKSLIESSQFSEESPELKAAQEQLGCVVELETQ